MARPTVLLSMGTRPEIIKMAPVYHALRGGPLQPVVVHTGQHRDLAWSLYRFFGMVPDRTLDLRRHRATLGHLNAQLLDATDEVLTRENAQAVLVHGDTSSALSAAMAGFYAGVPVGHVEAGLRSGDLANPFPEEMNRTMIARLARWHFAPTQGAVRNLRREGVAPEAISRVGNTGVDAVRFGLGRLAEVEGVPVGLPADAETWLADGELVLVTMHRRENWGAPIEDVAASVVETARAHPHLRVLWPVHPNPEVQSAVRRGLARGAGASGVGGRIRLVEPLSYPALLWALSRSWLVMTDSGGLQEEAAALGRPVLVLRATTERPEVIEAGGGALIGPSGVSVRAWVRDLAGDPDAHAALTCDENPYGDGRSGCRIAAVMAAEIGRPSPAASGPTDEAPATSPPVTRLPTPGPRSWPTAVQPFA